jgi:hypothetical protein
MWLRVVVVGVDAAASGRGAKPVAEVFCAHAVNGAPSLTDVPDQSLAAFCLPLGPKNQSAKEFMAPEVSTQERGVQLGRALQAACRHTRVARSRTLPLLLLLLLLLPPHLCVRRSSPSR